MLLASNRYDRQIVDVFIIQKLKLLPQLVRPPIQEKHAGNTYPNPRRGGPAQSLLSVRGLIKNFPLKGGWLGRGRGEVRAVAGVNFELGKGETLGIVGESGCGKATTSRLIMALMPPSAEEVVFDGLTVGARGLTMRDYRRQVQMVFQDSYSSLNPRVTIEDIVAFAPQVHGLGKREAPAAAHELLTAVGLNSAQFGRRYPHELSGGQRQRVNIARALALRPRPCQGYQEALALRIGHAYQQATDWHARLPPAVAGGQPDPADRSAVSPSTI
jgi:ABC-type glutathione transport system ATPase component